MRTVWGITGAVIGWTGCDRSCPVDTVEAGGDCGCALSLPVDPADLLGSELIWPFGVHGSFGHPEGHAGIDFISTETAPVRAPSAGRIDKIEPGSVGEYGEGPLSIYVRADCGIVWDFQPLVLDPALKVGDRVEEGQVLGTLAELVPPFGPGRFSVHYDTRRSSLLGGSEYESFCPAQFSSSAAVETLEALAESGTWDEKVARPDHVVDCADGTTERFDYPAEDQVCNPHLDETTKTRLESCLDLPPSRPVW